MNSSRSQCVPAATCNAGYYAGPKDKKGSYYCLPTRKTANAWCNRNNRGRGWRAGKIRRNGTFNCHRPKPRRRQPPVARNRGTPTPQHSPQSSAAVIGAIGGIIGAIGNATRSRQPTSRPSPTYTPPHYKRP